MFRPFSGWAIIMLWLEYRRKLIYYNAGIKNVRTRFRFTMFVEVRSYIYAMWNLRSLRFYLSCFMLVIIDTWAGVVFGKCFEKRWSVRSWLGWFHKWWLWRIQSGLWSNSLRARGVYISDYLRVGVCATYVAVDGFSCVRHMWLSNCA
jgi:hypothetical protein